MDVQTKQSTLASAKDEIDPETDDTDVLRPDGFWNASKQRNPLQFMEPAVIARSRPTKLWTEHGTTNPQYLVAGTPCTAA
jgi:hypothetical protein